MFEHLFIHTYIYIYILLMIKQKWYIRNVNAYKCIKGRILQPIISAIKSV